MRACLKCGNVNESSAVVDSDPCPGCGAIYAKVDEARIRAAAGVATGKVVTKSGNKRVEIILGQRFKLRHIPILIVILVAIVAVFSRQDYGVEGTGQTTSSSSIDSEYFTACSEIIERDAKWDYEWTSEWTSTRFTEVASTENGNKVYTGNSLKLQNRFGAWTKVGYICTYNPTTHTAIGSAIITK